MADSNTNKEQEQIQAQEEHIQAQEEQIQVILRHTNYTYAEAREKLIEHNNDYMAVIRSYLNQGMTPVTTITKPLSMNQQIYKEIRLFMDDADISHTNAS